MFMITKINKIKKLGLVFEDYAWDAHLPIFKQFNLVYGWNGSGKTTLSRFFAAIHGAPPVPGIEYEFEDAESNTFNERRLPSKLIELMNRQESERRDTQALREEAQKDAIEDATLEDVFEKAQGELKEWMIQNKASLELVDRLTKAFIDSINQSYGKASKGLFHYSRTREIAHARRGGDLSWNLDHMKNSVWSSALKEIESFKGEKGGKIDNLIGSLETLAHEYGHILEGLSAWSHDSKHDKEQASILVQFLVQNGPEKVLEALRPLAA